MDTRQLRFCKSIDCEKLDGMECKVDECVCKDKDKAVKEKQKKGVKHGGNS